MLARPLSASPIAVGGSVTGTLHEPTGHRSLVRSPVAGEPERRRRASWPQAARVSQILLDNFLDRRLAPIGRVPPRLRFPQQSRHRAMTSSPCLLGIVDVAG